MGFLLSKLSIANYKWEFFGETNLSWRVSRVSGDLKANTRCWQGFARSRPRTRCGGRTSGLAITTATCQPRLWGTCSKIQAGEWRWITLALLLSGLVEQAIVEAEVDSSWLRLYVRMIQYMQSSVAYCSPYAYAYVDASVGNLICFIFDDWN